MQDLLEARGFEVRYDCGRQAQPTSGKVKDDLARKLGRKPTDEEIAQAADLKVRDVHNVRTAARVVTSLDRPVGDDEDTTLGALLPSEEAGPEADVEISLRDEARRSALDRLGDREREMLKLRYGINGNDPTPISEISQRLGISPDGVRRLERKALAELAESRGLNALRQAA